MTAADSDSFQSHFSNSLRVEFPRNQIVIIQIINLQSCWFISLIKPSGFKMFHAALASLQLHWRFHGNCFYLDYLLLAKPWLFTKVLIESDLLVFSRLKAYSSSTTTTTITTSIYYYYCYCHYYCYYY